jgi:ElaB/YqjD/DUF883 family membrane-anchored ribosome-binding protein
MLESNLQLVNNDVNKIIADAQAMFKEALTLSGDKATEAHQRGMRMLDSAMSKANLMQHQVLQSGKEMISSADHYVKENPWRTVSAAASVGLLLGVILGRK